LDDQALRAVPLSHVQAALDVLSGERIYDPLHRDEVNLGSGHGVFTRLGQGGEAAEKEEGCHQAQPYESQAFIYAGSPFS